VRRVLGQLTDPVQPDSARAIVQRLDQLETKLDCVSGQVEWIASYLLERAEQQGRARGAPHPTPVTPPEQTREGWPDATAPCAGPFRVTDSGQS
jgi:hypothetical protein